ncbi:MAG: hypothetical protein QW273_02080 [Candidatus Pacearchaeota archaeon]
MNNKKGISEIVSNVLIVLIVVGAVGLIAAVVFPLIKSNMDLNNACSLALRDLSIDVESGYTCFNYSDSSFIVRVKKRSEDVNYTGVKFSLLYKNKNSNSSRFSAIFEKNSFQTFKITNIQNKDDLSGIELSPIVRVGKGEKECDVSSRIVLDNSLYCFSSSGSTSSSSGGGGGNTQSLFAGGKGTPTDPFQIATCQQLQNIKYALDSHFILNNDIDCYDYSFSPIGNESSPFTGSLSGSDVYKITNLSVRGRDYSGLFGYINGGRLYNFFVEGNVTGNNYVGLIAGYLKNANVTEVCAKGNSNGNESVGGLIGYANLSNISASCFLGELNSSFYAGGIAGYMENSSIVNSYSKLHSFEEKDGGIVGYMKSGQIFNSYSVGGYFIWKFVEGFASLSFFDKNIVDVESSCYEGNCPSGIQGKSTAEMKYYVTYKDVGWDIETDSTSSLNDGYPYLGWQEGNKEHVWFISSGVSP